MNIQNLHKELTQLNRKKKKKLNNPVKMGGGSEWTVFQRKHTDWQKVHEKMLIIKEMQIKKTMR